MAAYLIHLDPKSGYRNTRAMTQYSEQVGAIVEAFGGIYHARHQRIRVLEGQWDRDYITLIEFPSQAELLEFYGSEEYRPWLQVRKAAGDGDLLMIGA